MHEHQVRDGNRVFQFEGDLIAESSSWQPGQNRWVEFQLYRTRSGNYILSRTGQTRLYHDPNCVIVQRNRLKTSVAAELSDNSVACNECSPSDEYDDSEVAIERPRHFALVSDSPEAVIEALYKKDSGGAWYLTQVAQRLIEQAGEVDAHLDRAYRLEIID